MWLAGQASRTSEAAAPRRMHRRMSKSMSATCLLLAMTGALCPGRHLCFAQDSRARIATVCSGADSVNLSCPNGGLIKVENLTYGAMAASSTTDELCSSQTTSDCTYVETDKSYDCNGKQYCKIAMNMTKYYNSVVPKCGQRTSFVHIVYLCIPALDLIDVCSSSAAAPAVFRSRPGATSGYIGTTAYPRPHLESSNCSFTICGRRILLHAVDMFLDNKTDCVQTADDLNAYLWCGNSTHPLRYENTLLTYSDANALRLLFTSKGNHCKRNGRSRNCGPRLWLYFTAEPLDGVDSSCDNSPYSIGTSLPKTDKPPKAAFSKRQTTTAPTWARTDLILEHARSTERARGGDIAPVDKVVIVNNVLASVTTSDDPDHTLAKALGIIFGGLSFVLTAVIVLYLVRRFKCKVCSRRKRSPSCNHQVLLRTTTAEQFANIQNEAATDSGCEKESNDVNDDWGNNLSSGCRTKEYYSKVAVV